MDRNIVLMLFVIFSLTVSNYSYAQHEQIVQIAKDSVQRKIPIIREAKIYKKDSVAVEAQLVNGILEVMVEARMYAQKPRINDVLVKGPKLGRLHYQTRKTIVAGVEEEQPFEVTKERGWIVFGKRKKVRKLEGTLTKEFFKIKIPRDKIVCNKKYQLWVEIQSKTEDSRAQKFKFDLENFPELVRGDCPAEAE